MAAMQGMIGGEYVVSCHPVARAEPQFDVHPVPLEMDGFGNADVIKYSARVLRDINRQRSVGKAPPVWRG